MAELQNVRLKVGRVASGLEFAEVSYDIDFTGTERELNIRFNEHIILLERDDALDYLLQVYPAHIIRAYPRGNTDDVIGMVFKGFGTVRPDGNSRVHRQHRREWRFPDNETGSEEYRAIVFVIPEIWQASEYSNEVSINLA